MHPALSVIFFTTLSGAGYGLLLWSALAALASVLPARPLLMACVLGLALVSIGLISSLAHLGRPGRAWRALSQWRSSWLSREGVAALLTYAPALLLVVTLLPGALDGSSAPARLPSWGVAACLALAIGAIATVACTAMIYASLKPIPAWRHRLVLPGYLLFALLTGGLPFAALTAPGPLEGLPALLLGALAIASGLLKLRYWHAIDTAPFPADRGDAVGLPGRNVRVFERPHTQDNFVTREMIFALARKHAHRLRRLALLLFAVVPLLLVLPAGLLVHLSPGAWYAAAAVSALAGAFVERWLFFAEARHMVTLYY